MDALREEADLEVWLPNGIPYPERRLSGELEARGVAVWRHDLPVLRRSEATPAGMLRALRRMVRCVDLVREHRPSLLWVNGVAMAPLLLPAWVTRTPAVVHVHEVLERRERLLFAPLLALAQAVVAVSAACANALPISVRGRARVVPNAVPGPKAPPAARRTGPVRVLYAGRWTPRKGVRELLAAWCDTRREDLVLTVVGGRPPSGVGVDVAALAKETPGVTVVGEVTDLAPYLAACDVVVVPSVLPESSGLVVAEAAAMARPAIASATGGLTELVQDGATGWLVPPGDVTALANVLACLYRAEAHRRGTAARGEWERRWTPRRAADEVRAIAAPWILPRAAR